MSIELLKKTLRIVPDFPKAGVQYYDLTPLFSETEVFGFILDELADYLIGRAPDKLVAIEARGFIVGAALAGRLRLPFVPARKAGKLPAATVQASYALEYGQAMLEIHQDAIVQGDKVVVVDDLIATGGTVAATCGLVEQLGGQVVGIVGVIALSFLGFATRLKQYDQHYLVNY